MLLYVDDIVFMSTNESAMRRMLHTLHSWCKRWQMLINTAKSKSVHFRPSRSPRSEQAFSVGINIIETVESYKYLGVIFKEKQDFSSTAKALASGAGRTLGSIIAKMQSMKDFGFKTYEKLYESCITPILDYAASVLGFKCQTDLESVLIKAIRYFMGVHRFAPHLALYGYIGWLPCMLVSHG